MIKLFLLAIMTMFIINVKKGFAEVYDTET